MMMTLMMAMMVSMVMMLMMTMVIVMMMMMMMVITVMMMMMIVMMVCRHKSHRTSGGVIRDEVDLEREACVARISAMKNICNKLTIIEKEKKKIINGLKKEVPRGDEDDDDR
jgi:hypothetical protein